MLLCSSFLVWYPPLPPGPIGTKVRLHLPGKHEEETIWHDETSWPSVVTLLSNCWSIASRYKSQSWDLCSICCCTVELSVGLSPLQFLIDQISRTHNTNSTHTEHNLNKQRHVPPHGFDITATEEEHSVVLFPSCFVRGFDNAPRGVAPLLIPAQPLLSC